MSTPFPRCFKGGTNNGAHRELVIVPPANRAILLYNAQVGPDLAGTTTDFQIVSGTTVLFSKALAAAGSSDSISSGTPNIVTPMCLPRGETLTIRLTQTTGGTITATVAFV